MTLNQSEESLAREFEKIFSNHYSTSKRFAFMLLKSEEDAEDIAQEVFTKLWTQPQIWKGNDNINNYIYAMTKNLIFNFIKHKKIEHSYEEQLVEKILAEELGKLGTTYESIYYKEALLCLQLTLSQLPSKRRKIFEMSRFEEMTNLEIAEKLNISVRTVEHQIYLTLKDLKKTILFLFFMHFL